MIRDEELCRQLQQGSEAAMEALVHRHHRAVHAFLYRLTGEPHTAEDLAQECFIRLCTRIHSYHYPDPFLPWLYTVAHNLFRDWCKSAYRQRVVPQDAPEPVRSPIDLMERQALRSEAVRLLGALDEQHRSVLVLRYYQDLTVPQIAQVLAIAEGTVKSRLSNSIKRLRGMAEAERRMEHGGAR